MSGRSVRQEAPERPIVRRHRVGLLKVFSGAVLVEDLSCCIDVRLRPVPNGEHPVMADVIHYPEGGRRVAKVVMRFGPVRGRRKDLLGEVGVNSAKVLLTDARTRNRARWRAGPERLGVIVTYHARRLQKRFGL